MPAGGPSDDAIRSLVISHKLLGTEAFFVIHHTDCGMELFTDAVIGDLLADSLERRTSTATVWSNPHHGGGSPAGYAIDWLTIPEQSHAVTSDVGASARIPSCRAASRSSVSSTMSPRGA